MEEEAVVAHSCPAGDFVLSWERFGLYRLGLYPLRCHVCGLQKPNIMKEEQGERDFSRGENRQEANTDKPAAD